MSIIAKKKLILFAFAASFLILIFLPPVQAQRLTQPSARYPDTKADSTTTLRGIGFTRKSASVAMVLPQVASADIDRIQSRNKENGSPFQVGLNRELDAANTRKLTEQDFAWEAVPGGWVSRLTLSSPGALALRIKLAFTSTTEGMELRFFGEGEPEKIYGPFKEQDLMPDTHDRAFWSPVLEGETLDIELFIPEISPFSFNIAAVSHLFYSIINPLGNVLKEIGDSGGCNLDVVCYSDWDTASTAVAKMLFSTTEGAFLCSGTLLNDQDTGSWIPYFMTANHCIADQAAASTLTTYWFYTSDSCNSGTSGNYQQRSGGATLLATDAGYDYTFLRLNAQPPAGITYLGWDANPLNFGDAVTGIHHPSGDLQKISFGNSQGFGTFPKMATNGHILTRWNEGVTEGGSSGSPLMNSNRLFTGQLTGGSSSCARPHWYDYYGRFDLYYPAVSFWLDPALAFKDAVDNTELIWTTGGDANWFEQTGTAYYDNDAAQSGAISHSQSTYIETHITGPGTLSFYWQVSSESAWDWLSFSIDGTDQPGSISGDTAWAQREFFIGSGQHTLRWTYTKDGSVNWGSDAGWLDKVQFTPALSGCSNSVDPVIGGDVIYTGKEACVASASITTQPTVTVAAGANVAYKAPLISLGTGFTVQPGAQFRAGANIDTTGYPASTKAISSEPPVIHPQPMARLSTTARVEGPKPLAPADLPVRLRDLLKTQEANASDIAMDAAGRYIVFATQAALVEQDHNGQSDVYLYEVSNDTARPLSINGLGDTANGPSQQPKIDGGGRYVVYSSEASDLIPDDGNGVADIYIHDITADLTARVSLGTTGAESDRPASNPAIASNQPQILYHRVDADGYGGIYRYNYDWPALGTTLVSQKSNDQGLSVNSHHPAISTDGRYIAYLESPEADAPWVGCSTVRYDQEQGLYVRLDCPDGYDADNGLALRFAADGETVVWEQAR